MTKNQKPKDRSLYKASFFVFSFLSILWGAIIGLASGQTATFTPLGDLPGGSFGSEVRDLSNDGTTVVGDSGSEAFRWTSSGGIQGLGDLPGGGFFSDVYAVSGDGTVAAGRSQVSLGLVEAFRWTPGSGMVGLGILPSSISDDSQARFVSEDGSVVVGYGTLVFPRLCGRVS